MSDLHNKTDVIDFDLVRTGEIGNKRTGVMGYTFVPVSCRCRS